MAELTWKGKAAGRRGRTAARLVREEIYGEPQPEGWGDKLIHGAAERVLPRLRDELTGQVALVYVDPPFDTGGSFDYLASLGGPKGVRRVAVPAYSDARGLDAWLTWFSGLAQDLHALLVDGGSLYVHLDAHVVHYAKVVLDEVFGIGAFQREIVWRIGWVSGFKSRARSWIRNHDTLLFYAKGGAPKTFHKTYLPYPDGYKRRDGKPASGRGYPLDDVWNGSDVDRLDSIQIMSFSGEKLGYPTQKNEALVARIVRASSDPGDLVLDCCAGSGTTAAVASKLGRRWIVCDAGPLAIHVARKRLAAAAPPRAFTVERDGLLSWIHPSRALALDWKVHGQSCAVTFESYELPRHAESPGGPDLLRLDGYAIDWQASASGLRAETVAWRDRRGDLPLRVTHVYERPGTYRVRVRAFDALGGFATRERSVRVGPRPRSTPKRPRDEG